MKRQMWTMARPMAIAMVFCCVLSGCDDGETPDIAGPECRLNSDCAVGQVCDGGACVDHESCQMDEGCPCAQDAQCASGQLCNVDQGTCFAVECLTLRDCQIGELCRRGRCLPDLSADRDQDGVADVDDNCPDTPNGQGEDSDRDGRGDACDDDDDNDGAPDAIDNCPLAANASQADADNDGVGNACDDDTIGTTVTGRVDLSALPGADPTQARVLLSGNATPVVPDAEGVFVFDQGLTDGGIFGLSVSAPGFIGLERIFESPKDVDTFDVGTLALSSEAGDPDRAVSVRGSAQLEGRDTHADITVRARIDGRITETTTTDEAGDFAISLARVDHTLTYAREGYITQSRALLWDADAARLEFDGAPLEEADPIILLADRSAALQGQLVSAIEGFDFTAASVTVVGAVRIGAPVERDGTFGVNALVPGLAGLEIDAPGHTSESRILSLTPGVNDLDELEMRPIEVAMAGTVRLQNARTHDDIVVRLRREGVLLQTTLTDAEGLYAFRTLPLPHTLTISKDNYLPQEIQVEFGEQGFEFDEVNLNEVEIELLPAPQSDRDADGAIDSLDNCAETFNPDQNDIDRDGLGDRCDSDMDNDGLSNGLDNCPQTHNPSQEDPDGDGLGIACQGGGVDAPFPVGCGVRRQRLDTSLRPDAARASCGGASAPEVAYRLTVEPDSRFDIDIKAEHATVLSLIDPEGNEVFCRFGAQLTVFGDPDQPDAEGTIGVPPNDYTLIVDGLVGRGSSGAMTIDIHTNACIPRFEQGSAIDLDFSPFDVSAGDFDGNGNADLVAINNEDGLVIVPGLPDGDYDEPRPVDMAGAPYIVRVADLDGDNNLDISVVTNGSRDVVVLLGNGDLTFQPERRFSVSGNAFGFAVKDATQDGNPDLIVTTEDGRMIILSGAGDGTFDFDREIALGQIVEDIHLRDINNDTIPDLVVNMSYARQAGILPGTGGGQYGAVQHVPIEADVITQLDVADFNNDGRLDLSAASVITSSAIVLLNQGDGTFVESANMVIGDATFNVMAGDLNLDGKFDIIATDIFQSSVTLALGNGDGTFETPRQIASVGQPFSARLVDLNQDGAIDIVVGELNNNRISAFLSNGDGTMAGSIIIPTTGSPVSTASADYDEDGAIDIALIQSGASEVTFVFGDGEGGIKETTTLDAGGSLRHVSTADLDGDGHADIVYAMDEPHQVVARFGAGDATFSQPLVLSGTFFTRGIFIEDFNKDGRPDVLSANFEDIKVSLNNGNRGFAPPFNVFEERLINIDVFDMNNDGHMDIVVSMLDSRLLILEGQGDGTFVETASHNINGQASTVRAGDLDRDSFADLIIEDSLGSILLYADPAGGFFPPIRFNSHDTMALNDYNSDGWLDLVIHDNLYDRLEIHINQGERRFTHHITLSTSGALATVELVDFANDGVPDLVTTNFNNQSIQVFPTTRTRTFSTTGSAEVGSAPETMRFGDLNGDGIPDVATVNVFGDNIGYAISDGLGGFRLSAQLSSPDWAEDVRIKDVDRNGRNDIVMGDNYGNITVYSNLGDDRFSDPIRVLDETHCRRFAMEDFDGDGELDIMGYAPFDDTFKFFRGRPGIDFETEPVLYPFVSGSFLPLTVLDMNEDGAPDLVGSLFDPGQLIVMLNDNQGGFLPIDIHDTVEDALDFTHADVDNDGHIDILVNGFHDRLRLHMGRGDGTFSRSIDYDFEGVTGRSTLLDDVTEDGLQDLVYTAFEQGIIVRPGDGQGGFGRIIKVPLFESPFDMQAVDVTGDGTNELIYNDRLANGRVFVKSFNKPQTTTSVAIDSPLQPCATQRIDLNALDNGTFAVDIPDNQHCRIERMELDLTHAPDGFPAALDIRSPQFLSRTTRSNASIPVQELAWRPSQVSGLARFEGHPLVGGRWALESSADLDAAQIIVNHFPSDPFGDDPAPICQPEEDAPFDPDAACVLQGPLIDASIENGFDEDTLILPGTINGAFYAGRAIEVTLTHDPDAAIDAGIRPLRGHADLPSQREVLEPGVVRIIAVIPATFDQRHMALHVRPTASLSDAALYSVTFAETNAIEILCQDRQDNDLDGLRDCADPDCAQDPACQ